MSSMWLRPSNSEYVSLDFCVDESTNSLSLRFIKGNIHYGDYISVLNMSIKP